jgi:4-hydroxybenzoate polyprenyltransferase
MIPLVLDLDGTLVPTDTLVENLLRVLAERPLALVGALAGLVRNRAAFKHRLAAAVTLDPAGLVYNQEILALARQARAEGRPVFLATAADQSIAESVARHLALFDGVWASDGTTNLKGAAKAEMLVRRFGAGNFDYAGDSPADRAVWAQARRAILVAPSAALLGQVTADVQRPRDDIVIMGGARRPMASLRLLARALRLHQWAKNVLLFVPMVAAHRVQAPVVLAACFAFLSFSLCASSVYLVNDLLDLPHDRAHPTKRRRPFASGALDLARAPALVAVLLALTLAAAAALPLRFMMMLAIYYVGTLSYSFVLKRRMVWDVMMLAGLYTIRIFAGAAATRIPISPWLLAFALFLFFCLAVVKRLTELTLFVQGGQAPGKALAGRGYGPADLDMLRSMATSSGYMAVLVMALYVNSGEVLPLYHTPAALWALCPILLFWVSRVLMLANRGLMNDDPVVFALRDRVSLLTGLAALLAIVAATL